MVETKNCFEFVEGGFTGEGLSSAVGGTHYQWLSDLVDQFRSEQESYDRICEEKTAAVTEQISVLQSESDQLGTAVRKLGAETLGAPSILIAKPHGFNLSVWQAKMGSWIMKSQLLNISIGLQHSASLSENLKRKWPA